MIRRVFEIFFSLTVLVLSTPFLCLFSLVIFLEDFNSPLFIQKRLGRAGKYFSLFKLRTMKVNSPQVGTHEVDDNLYLNSSKLIRKLKLDELPQFYNVLVGDMTIVGPRPCLPSQKTLIEARENNSIFAYTPGITGISQLLNIMMDEPELQAKTDRIYGDKKSQNIYFYMYCIINTVFKIDSDLKYLKTLSKISDSQHISYKDP